MGWRDWLGGLVPTDTLLSCIDSEPIKQRTCRFGLCFIRARHRIQARAFSVKMWYSEEP